MAIIQQKPPKRQEPIPTFSIDDAEAATRKLRFTYHHDDKWTDAIGRAAEMLPRTRWQWDAKHRELLIESQTSPTYTLYHVTARGCECRAAQYGRMCDHMGAWHILRTAQEYAEVNAKR